MANCVKQLLKTRHCRLTWSFCNMSSPNCMRLTSRFVVLRILALVITRHAWFWPSKTVIGNTVSFERNSRRYERARDLSQSRCQTTDAFLATSKPSNFHLTQTFCGVCVDSAVCTTSYKSFSCYKPMQQKSFDKSLHEIQRAQLGTLATNSVELPVWHPGKCGIESECG